MSSSNDDLGSIEPAVSLASEPVPEVRVRPFSSLQSEGPGLSLQTARCNLPAPVSASSGPPSSWSHTPIPSFLNQDSGTHRVINPDVHIVSRPRPSSSVQTALPNTTIRRIVPLTVEGRANAILSPRSRSPLHIHPPPPPSSPPRINITAPRLPARLRYPNSRSPSPVSPPQSALYSPIQLPTFPPPINPPRFEPMRARAARSPPQLDRIQRDSSPSPPATAPRPPSLRINIPDLVRGEERREEERMEADRVLGFRTRRGREDDFLSDSLRLRDRLQETRRRQGQQQEAVERNLRRVEEHNRALDRGIVEEFRREADLSERARLTARRSFERANSVLEASLAAPPMSSMNAYSINQTLRLRAEMRSRTNAEGRRSQDQDLANEFVRDTSESRPTAPKRPRIDQENETQYDADIAEALSRSLADQGSSRSVASASGDQPQPGCSHWSAPPAAPAQVNISMSFHFQSKFYSFQFCF